MNRDSKVSCRLACFTALVVVALAAAYKLPAQDLDAQNRAARMPGQRVFDSNCAGCHGLDGRGGDKGIDIVDNMAGHNLTDTKLRNIIAKGIAGTSMPAFPELNQQQARNIIGYLRSLQGSAEARDLPGDAVRGKAIFFGSAGCSNCHTLAGNGGFLGPDLSSYGTNSSVPAIREAITKRDRVEPAGYRSAVLTTLQGERLEGVIRNEDNFSIQLLAKDGTFHFFQRADLQKAESLGHSLMPSDYGDRLSAADLNDLVSYIIKSASSASTKAMENPWE
jgi:putative heme-binding domain-containing protein